MRQEGKIKSEQLLALLLERFNAIRHQQILISKCTIEITQFQEEIRIRENDVVFHVGDVVKRFPSGFSGLKSFEQNPVRLKAKQARVIWIAGLMPIQAITVTKPIKNVAIAADTYAQINWPATVIHPINTSLEMVEQSRWLTIKTMKLKNQPSQGINSWLGVGSQ